MRPRVAPPLLELTENDKFVDDEGNVFEVEIRGERNEDEVTIKFSPGAIDETCEVELRSVIGTSIYPHHVMNCTISYE